MKRLTNILPLLAVLAVFAMGAYSNYLVGTFKAKPKVAWRPIGSLSTVETTPAVTARGWTAMTAIPDANSIQWLSVPDDASSAEFRFSTTTDGDDYVLEVWLAANDRMSNNTLDSFTLGSILTIKGGTQTGPYSNVFVDTIAAVDYGVIGSLVYDSAANRMARWKVNLAGWKKVVIIATTYTADKTLYADVRW